MNCIDTKKNIEALIDGELDGALKDAVESHLLICTACCEMKEEMILLSSFLQTSQVASPSVELNERVMKSFKNHHAANSSWWWRTIFGAFVIPKPVFATLLILAATSSWLAFQIGKINSATVSMTTPFVITKEIPVQTTADAPVQTVVVKVPIVKEKKVTRTVYVREQKNIKNEKGKSSADSTPKNSPSYSSTVAGNGYFTDVNLKGFEPSAEINAKIIKEVKEDEK
ncbi:MAG: zf-HC2 domain-containing protein [Acidobacteria bacterium]|nr:zf-HC2 domain-containing protein [Acidobacteriota bacterium]MCA1636758.1 zf-HC2 domain-containing protein [Acidobacteriota bacterium]